MDHTDHVNLLRGGLAEPGGVWADFGSGTGAFTLALAELIGPGGELHSVDRDSGALREQRRALQARFPAVTVHQHIADFTRPMPGLPPLDGIVAANTLHFQRDPAPLVALFKQYLRPQGRLIVVEYNVAAGNYAVPFPLPFTTWQALAAKCEFKETRLLLTRPSRFLREIYSAVSFV